MGLLVPPLGNRSKWSEINNDGVVSCPFSLLLRRLGLISSFRLPKSAAVSRASDEQQDNVSPEIGRFLPALLSLQQLERKKKREQEEPHQGHPGEGDQDSNTLCNKTR